MTLISSISNAWTNFSASVHDGLASARESFHAVKNTVVHGVVEVLEHVSPRKRRRPSSTPAASLPSTPASPITTADIQEPPPSSSQPQAKRPRLADPEADLSHFPSPFLPPRVPLSAETPPRPRASQSFHNPRIEAAVAHGLASIPRPHYPTTPARYSSHVPALDPRKQFFQRSYAAAFGTRTHASEPLPSSKPTPKSIHPASVRKSVYKRRFRNPQRRFASAKALARNTRLHPLRQSYPSTQPNWSPHTSPQHRVRQQETEAAVEVVHPEKDVHASEGLETAPSPATVAEQIANLPPIIAKLLQSDHTLGKKLLKLNKHNLLRIADSGKKSKILELEHFIKCQQLHSIKREQEESRRIANLRPPLKLLVKEKPQAEQPPQRAPHFYESRYWLPLDAKWHEDQDDRARRERDFSVTVTDPESAYAPLTDSAVYRLRATLGDASNQDKELSSIDGCIIRGDDLRRLRPNNWLNDEIVNAYMNLIAARATIARKMKHGEIAKPNGHRSSFGNGNGLHHVNDSKRKMPSSQQVPKLKVISSFFYSTLFKFNPQTRVTEYNYSRVKRWTRRFDVFEYDLMLIPINQQNLHWTLGVINFKDKVVAHLDSMGKGGSPEVRENLLRWVRDEAETKGHEFQAEEWSADDVLVPQQTNSDDCGVFLCKYADFLSRGWSDFTFSQDHMSYFRARMAHELLMKRA